MGVCAVGLVAQNYGPVHIFGIKIFSTYLFMSYTDFVPVLCNLYVHLQTHSVETCS